MGQRNCEGVRGPKSYTIVTCPTHVKLGIMHKLTGMYTHNTLSVDYETLDYDDRK